MHTRCSRLACAGDTFLWAGCFDKICFHILLVLRLVEHFKLPCDILVLQILHITKLLSPSDISKCYHTCDFILNVRNVNVLEFEGNNVNDSQIIFLLHPALHPNTCQFPKSPHDYAIVLHYVVLL